MKVILVGHPGSQIIVPASKYLTKKYLPHFGFDITYLNYKGDIHGWAAYLKAQLFQLPDKYIIFSLDDYLIADYIDMVQYRHAESIIGKNGIVCVKLCETSIDEHIEYPVTTQYCIWDREYLIWLLEQVNTPWEFEIQGSRIFNKTCMVCTCLKYFTNSSLSGRWEGVNVAGLKDEDVEIIKHMIGEGEGTTKEDVSSTDGIVVFGGSGYLGTALIDRLTHQGHKNITAVARNEGSLVALKEKFPTVRIMVGDIADPWIVKKAMIGAQQIYLLSAMKHVGLAESQVRSCISTNIIGCMNVVNESFLTKPKSLVFISSDKAAQGTGVYGSSKRIGERLMAEAEQINPDTKYSVIRYGNVWGSTGSIVTKWKPKMENRETVILTDPEATRFFWTVDDAVDLIFQAQADSRGATPYVPVMKAVSMKVVLEACAEVFCPDGGEIQVRVIGLQPGENKHETMDGITFSDQVEQFTKEEFTRKFLWNHRWRK